MAGFLDDYDKRTRRVILLAGAAALAVVGAAVSLMSTAEREAPAFERQAFFPEIDLDLAQAARLEIVDTEGSFVIERTAQEDWVLPAKDGFPADIRPLRAVFQGLRGLDILAPKTANPEWHGALDLIAPGDGGDAVEIRLSDAEGNDLAAILIGKDDETGTVSGLDRFHARRPDEAQTWLVTGRVPRDTDPVSWLNTRLVSVERDSVSRADIRLAEGDSYSVIRPAPGERDFVLDPVPEGREVRTGFIVNGVATAVAGLAIEDVQAREGYDLGEPVGTSTFRTYEGLVLDIEQFMGAEEESERWITIAARAEPQTVLAPEDDTPEEGAAENAEEAETDADAAPASDVISAEIGTAVTRINTLAAGRIFRIPLFAGDQMGKPVEDLLSPLEEPEEAEGETGTPEGEDAPEGAAAGDGDNL